MYNIYELIYIYNIIYIKKIIYTLLYILCISIEKINVGRQRSSNHPLFAIQVPWRFQSYEATGLPGSPRLKRIPAWKAIIFEVPCDLSHESY